jgi:hypothetical protein
VKIHPQWVVTPGKQTKTNKPIHTSGTSNNAVHDLTLIKLKVARLVGTGGF